ncbi:MAG: methionyl-tRNA formyltransferase [Opitutaceae bacterium]|nr:methionyl-tRNA formyltransferase [Opitutaceae bacterium]
MAMLRLVFMGSDAIARPALEWLAGPGNGLAQIVAIYTQPDRPSGRGQKVTPNAIKQWALTHGLPVFQPVQLTLETCGDLARLGADVALVMAYGQILKDDVIATPRLGTLNLHASLLPKYRGASPIQTAVACGESQTGVTLMRVSRRLDAGPTADAERVPVGSLDTAAEVEARLADAFVPLLARTLPKLAVGSLEFRPQEETQATYCRRLEKADGALDFAASAAVLAARINGLHPWPGCFFETGGQTVKVGLAEALPDSRTGPAGQVVGVDAIGLLVATGSGFLRLHRLQRPGGRMLPAPEFLRGHPIAPGTLLPSHPMASLVSSQSFPRRKR